MKIKSKRIKKLILNLIDSLFDLGDHLVDWFHRNGDGTTEDNIEEAKDRAFVERERKLHKERVQRQRDKLDL
jgi:uncharacterized protein YutE (UPF0331/DUF86 family)